MAYQILQGDVLWHLGTMAGETVQCCVTSPPYWGLRDYGTEGQLGLEKTPQEFVANMVAVFREVRRVLRDDGVCFVNIGDSYTSGGRNGHGTKVGYKQQTNRGSSGERDSERPAQPPGLKPKDLVLIPERLAIALQDAGWWIRSRIAWTKGNAMPESVRDRPTSAWEHIWMLTKASRYYCDMEAVRQRDAGHNAGNKESLGAQQVRQAGGANTGGTAPTVWRTGMGANLRNHWHINPEPFSEAHFATFPSEIPRRCILMGTSAKGCCPECGAPWERVVEKTSEPDPTGKGSTFDGGKTGARDGGDRTQTATRTLNQTTGWRPVCDCPIDPARGQDQSVPCTVLDPFAGSGTSLMVAEQLGRDSIGIELSEEYVAMAERRIQAGLPVTQRKHNETGEFRLEATP